MCKCRSVNRVQFAEKYSVLEVIAFDILDVSSVVRVFIVYRAPYYNVDAHQYAELLIDWS